MTYYRPSGQRSPRMAICVLASAIAFAPIAWLYAWLLLHITDPTFLYLRGVPQLSVFLENSREVVTSALSQSEARRWYESIMANIDSSGQEALSRWIHNGMPELPQSIA